MSDLDALAAGEYILVVDAIEDGLARVFLEQDGTEVGSTVVSVDQIPQAGRHADAVLAVTIADGALADLRYLPDTTRERKTAAQRRFDDLADRRSADDSDE